MAGIYIHIPFCKKICYYCDFYKTRQTDLFPGFLTALYQEIEQKKDYLNGESVDTIYFGGGTPSLLSGGEITRIILKIKKHFLIKENVEITVEANPEDLTDDYIKTLYQTGINRLSIGCQSFRDVHLMSLNRRHNAKQARNAVENAFREGFENISIDLIYGLPELGLKEWKENLKIALKLPITHFSAYHLTIEKNTVYFKWQQKGKIRLPEEEESLKQYRILLEMAEQERFDHYEISNFCKMEKYSRHNMLYWNQEKYLGLGPSAHSYDGFSRQWNGSNIKKYIQGVLQKRKYSEKEKLNTKTKFNEYLMTRLRTKWGISQEEIQALFGLLYYKKIKGYVLTGLKTGNMEIYGERIRLTEGGMFLSDHIISELFITD
ncbi:MAG: radical SAM family heme chaperone HemW [Chlorobi bacterium]|nr:radical SAM family heme chaperone HemW [Chlorobiota bacterium]